MQVIVHAGTLHGHLHRRKATGSGSSGRRITHGRVVEHCLVEMVLVVQVVRQLRRMVIDHGQLLLLLLLLLVLLLLGLWLCLMVLVDRGHRRRRKQPAGAVIRQRRVVLPFVLVLQEGEMLPMKRRFSTVKAIGKEENPEIL